jgi:hypothetical protein
MISERCAAISEKVSKFLLLVLIPLFGLLNWALFYRKRKHYYDHFIYTTEISSFFLLWGFLILPSLLFFVYLIPGLDIFDNEWVIAGFIIIPFIIFIILAAIRFYNLNKLQSILFALLYVAAFIGFILTIYKLILFFITIHLV